MIHTAVMAFANCLKAKNVLGFASFFPRRDYEESKVNIPSGFIDSLPSTRIRDPPRGI